MQRGRKAVMRAECKGNATAKARGQGARGRGQRGRGEQPSQRRKRALAHKTTQQHETTQRPPRLFPFAPFGEGSDPLAPCPSPLPPTSLLFRLHPLASACIGFSPFASACIGLQPRHPLRVGSGRVVGSVGRVGGSGLLGSVGRVGVAALPLPLPKQLARRQREWGFDNPTFFLICSQSIYTYYNSSTFYHSAFYIDQFHPLGTHENVCTFHTTFVGLYSRFGLIPQQSRLFFHLLS